MKQFLAALVVLWAIAPSLLADERILSFDSRIVIEKDGDLVVTEILKVRAERKQIKRGIFRDIPKLQRDKFGLKKKKPFKVLSVKRDGKKEHHVVEDIGQGGMRIRIGRENHFLQKGTYTYEIQYRTEQQLRFEDDRDVLYWNVNGTEWAFPIDKVTAVVEWPEGITPTKLWGFTGKMGGKGEAYKAEIKDGKAYYETTRKFGPKENLTIGAEWPRGLLDQEAYTKVKTNFLRDHPLFLLACLVLAVALIYYLIAWSLVGQDPAKGVIIPQYDPPAGFSPAAVRYLHRMGFDNTCFSAAVVGLAVKGALSIDKEGETYVLKKKGGTPQALVPEESALFSKLMGGRKKIKLKQTNHLTIGAARKGLKSKLSTHLEKTHFFRNLKWWLIGLLLSLVGTVLLVFATGSSGEAMGITAWLAIWTVGCSFLVSRAAASWKARDYGTAIPGSLFAVPFVVGWFFGAHVFYQTTGWWAVGGLGYAATLNFLFYHLIKAPTRLGRRLMDHIEGFRKYLSVAEEDRLNLQNPPDRTPELFERFLPYALALDCEQKWSEQFDSVLQAAGRAPGGGGSSYSPSFYSGSHSGMGTALVSSMGGALTGALASSSSSPSSGGGGGSSGGGGGGGGGGGW